MKSKTYIFGILLTIALCASVYVHAATRYVSHSGSNTFPYTGWETAANTIEAANLATLPGDTMFVDTGSFYLSARPFLQPNVTLRGKGTDSTTVLGADSLGVMFRPYDSVVVEDIHFVGHGSYYAFLKYATEPHQSFFCRRCKFSNFVSSILGFDNNREIDVRDCWFENWGGLSYALSLTGPGDLTIENNTFEGSDNTDFVCEFVLNTGTIIFRKNIVTGGWSAVGGGSLRLEFVGNIFYNNLQLNQVMTTGADDVVFAQNSIFLTHDDWDFANIVLWQYLDWLDTCLVYNNIFAGFRPQIYFFDDLTTDPVIKISYNCFYSIDPYGKDEHIASRTNGTPLEIDSVYGNVYADPMLVDPWKGDLRLQRGSPCIDAGAPWILDVDGTRSDIGAFGGPDGEFYIYQDLPPQQPQKFDAWRSNGRVIVQWQRNSESDLKFYVLFRNNESDVPLDSGHVLAYFDRSGRAIVSREHRRPLGFGDGGRHVDPQQVIMPYADSTIWMTYFGDYTASPDHDYYYALVAVDSSGLISTASTATVGAAVHGGVGNPFPTTDNGCQERIPDSASSAFLEPNYPNPFNATTAIVYSLPNIGAQPAPIRLTIFNSLGQQVRVLVDDRQMPGRHIIYWNSDDDLGRQVASGIYFYRLEVSGIEFVKSGKMILMK